MPRLIAKVEGKGNGIKTVIDNMTDVAKALERPPTYCTKFFGCELGAQTQFDLKNDRYIVNGAHDASKLQDLLDIFIRKFVLCKQCANPETALKVYSKKNIITASCKACGHCSTLDMRHKLTTYIVKNPPEQSLNDQGTSLTQRKEKRSMRKDDESNEKAGKEANVEEENHEESIEWLTDVSEKAVEERMKDLSMGIKGSKMDNDMDKSEKEKMDIFHEFVNAKKEGGKISQADEKEISTEAERLEISSKATIVLCEVFLDGDKIVPQIAENKRLFLRFTNNNQKAQRSLIGGLECLIADKEQLMLPKATAIFKAFYDYDIIDEEVILEWGKKVSKKYVSKELSEKIHEKVKPFITWLKEAEEEESDESDEDLELEFDERVHASGIKEKKEEPVKNGKDSAKPAEAATPPKPKEKDDDLDIDSLDVDNNEDNLEDDTVLLEDETEIDPVAEGIKPKEDGEEEY
jgi:translation initiation factor 5